MMVVNRATGPGHARQRPSNREPPPERSAVGNTYKKIEIVGTSSESVDKAIQSGVDRARETVKNMDWFEVTELRGRIGDAGIEEYQVALKIGFRLD